LALGADDAEHGPFASDVIVVEPEPPAALATPLLPAARPRTIAPTAAIFVLERVILLMRLSPFRLTARAFERRSTRRRRT